LEVKVQNRKVILDDYFNVDVATLQYEKFDGKFSETVRRYNLNRPEAVAVLVYLTDVKRLLLIKQFRYADFVRRTKGWLLEIVAGVMDGNEAPLECAKRETIEETGYEIHNFEHIASVYSTPGITTEFVHIYLGTGTSADLKHEGGGLDDEHEDIQLIELTPKDTKRMLADKQIRDAKTILALQYFLSRDSSPAE